LRCSAYLAASYPRQSGRSKPPDPCPVKKSSRRRLFPQKFLTFAADKKEEKIPESLNFSECPI
jgi:hypothetical protein